MEQFDDPDLDDGIILRWIFRKSIRGGGAWNGLRWLRRGTGDGQLSMQ